MIINSVLCMLYYNVIIGWALFYFISSFRKELLWKRCDYWWNDNKCITAGTLSSTILVNDTRINCTQAQYDNKTTYGCVPLNITGMSTATEQFYQ